MRLGDLERSPELLIFALRYFLYLVLIKKLFSDPDREKGKLSESPCKFSRRGLERYSSNQFM